MGGRRLSDHVHGIVVTYHPRRESLSALLDAIAPQVDRIVLVDNGSVDQHAWLRGIGESGSLELLLLNENVGVAAAHNMGIAKARALGADAVLLLDQDSVPAPDMVVELRRALLGLQRDGVPVAAVGPCHVDERTGEQLPFLRFGFLTNEHLYCEGMSAARRAKGEGEGTKGGAQSNPEHGTIECDHLITSGTLIPLSSLERVGGLDESLFVDNVDTEWCFRAISKGYKLFGVCSARMSHAVGDALRETWVPYSDEVVIHPPIRLYYIIRNHLLLYGRASTPARWTIQDAPRLVFKAALFTTSISPRLKNLSMIVKGLWDGVRGQTGPYERR